MYDLVSHLIYLDNFSEMKTSKTSLGKEIPIPAPPPPPTTTNTKFPGYFWAFLALLWGEEELETPPPPPTTREPTPGREERAASSSRVCGPTRDVKLINFIMVVSSLMFFFAVSRL